jgi:hypothetical protein
MVISVMVAGLFMTLRSSAHSATRRGYLSRHSSRSSSGDMLPAANGGAPHSDERFLLRHIARLGETLAELGDNLSSR